MNGLNTRIFEEFGDQGYNAVELPGEKGEHIQEFAGVEMPGFWSKAWKIARATGADVEQVWGDILLGAVEQVAETPEITEQSPGYLLQAATWRAQNARSKRNSTYLRKTHDIQVVSLDRSNRKAVNEKHEQIAAPTVDHDLTFAVRQVVSQLEDAQDRELCQLLMAGYSESEAAEKLGRSRSWVTYHKKNRIAPLLETLIA